MKVMIIPSLLLTLTLIVACDSAAPTAPGDSGETPAGSSDSADDAGAGDAAVVPSDDVSAATQSVAHPAPTVPDVNDSLPVVSDQLAAETEEPIEPVAPTLEDYESQLMAAVRAQDIAKAFEVVDAALMDFPEDVGIQVNRFLLHMRHDSETEQADPDAAATQFITTAQLGRDLLELGEQLPAQSKRIIPYAFFNEARGYAHQGQVAESLQALQSAVEAGLLHIEMDEDKFFAAVKDNEEFQVGLEAVLTAVRERMREEARREIDETTSFAFDFELKDLEQSAVKLADFKGKVVIVDIWGTWCPPCRKEIPHLIKLRDEYADDLAVVGINYEHGEGSEAVEKIRAFAQEYGINYPCVIGDQATQDQVPNLRGFPTTLFLDREGTVRLMIVGYHPYDKLDAYVSVLLAEGKDGDASS